MPVLGADVKRTPDYRAQWTARLQVCIMRAMTAFGRLRQGGHRRQPLLALLRPTALRLGADEIACSWPISTAHGADWRLCQWPPRVLQSHVRLSSAHGFYSLRDSPL